MTPIQVLAVTSSLDGGGAERQMVLLLKHLDRTRFAPSLCLFSTTGPFMREIPPDVPVIDLGKTSRWDAARLVIRLADVIRHDRPQVVLSKLDYPNVVTALANRLSLAAAPLVVVEEAVQSRELPTMSHSGVRRALLRWAYRRAETVVVPAPGVAEDLRTNVGLRARAFDVIPNMVDVEAAERAGGRPVGDPFHDGGEPLIATLGRLAESKGQRDLLAAIAILNETRPCNLVVAGTGGDEGRLRAMARELGIAGRVSFPGFLDNPVALLRRADVFVSPSHHESFGNTIIEAMAAGCPVVSTRVPTGPEWIIADGETGLFAAPRDPADLARKVALLLDDSALRDRLAEQAREVASARYGVEAVVGAYEQLFERVATR
jgi:glycosyltransferase involved in cell wall biosynthesis